MVRKVANELLTMYILSVVQQQSLTIVIINPFQLHTTCIATKELCQKIALKTTMVLDNVTMFTGRLPSPLTNLIFATIVSS